MWLKTILKAAVFTTIASMVQPAIADALFDQTPDSPEGFGFKSSWFAVKTQEPKRVAEILGLVDLQRANWASGIAAAYSFNSKPNGNKYVFISPPVTGWVLVVGLALPYPDRRSQGRNANIDSRFNAMFGALVANFDEVQFFGSYRVVGFEAWGRANGGRIEREFCYADGEVYANVGPQTSVEKLLKFPNLSGMTPQEATSAIFSMASKREAEEQRLVALGLTFKDAKRKTSKLQRGPLPSEGDAMAIAGHWSIDPTRIEELKLSPSVGYVAVLPSQIQQ
ncbi:hypothetical protein [Rhodoferax sp. U11-2br]|uniref:hypothetical protein n=1 Tax=Rhodoferax sp. U11-2br TaxID=2838878 RepID=UPI001BE58DC3|nr:hypothetical protein [Rhodoferax sp. U11-2br]MBT3068770.1 hypothetical protein [Rhodoferax sp. U11-2br]